MTSRNLQDIISRSISGYKDTPEPSSQALTLESVTPLRIPKGHNRKSPHLPRSSPLRVEGYKEGFYYQDLR